MKDKVKAAIKNNNMLNQGDNVTVALSGGADSVALLCILLDLKDELGINISAVHVNHHLRGDESDRDERFCAELCKTLGIGLTVKHVNVNECAENEKMSVEEAARKLRYEALQEEAADNKIATAHTLSDNIETVIFNLIRGTGLDGMCGIPKTRDNIVRPLINCSRTEIEEFLAAKKQTYINDSTNLSDIYTRNAIRHKIVPLFYEINQSLDKSIGNTIEILSDEREFLDQEASKALSNAARDVSKPALNRLMNNIELSREVLLLHHRSIRTRALKLLLSQHGVSYNYDALNQIEELLISGSGAVQLTGEVRVAVSEKMLILERKPQEAFEGKRQVNIDNLPVAIEAESKLKLNIYELNKNDINFFVNNANKQYKFAIDCDKIDKIIDLRSREDGDSVLLFNRGCSKSLKKLFNESGIPAHQRDRVLILSDSRGIIWIEGFGVSQRAALYDDTKHAIFIDIQEG